MRVRNTRGDEGRKVVAILPISLFARLRRQSLVSGRTMTSLVTEALDRALPRAPTNAPMEYRP